MLPVCSILFASFFGMVALLPVAAFPQVNAGRAVPTIRGTLLKSDGMPLAYTEIELVPISSEHIVVDHRLNATSSTGGKFSFIDVPVGRYTLSINFDDKPTELSPYDTFYYPVSSDRSAAQIFEVDDSTRINDIVFRLPPALQQKPISGQVLWEDGRPVEGAWIGFWDVKVDRSISLGMPRTDKNGNFKVIGFAGRSYRVGAVVFDREPRSPFDSPGNVIAAGESNTFALAPETGIVRFKVVRSAESRRLLDKYIGQVIFLN